MNVQGLDYAYTIQGWIKGVNSNTMNTDRDIGKDGVAGTMRAGVAKDGFGYTLGYFEGDYQGIGSTGSVDDFEASTGGSDLMAARQDLWNGNIGHMVTCLPNAADYTSTRTINPEAYGNAYNYDQLNRLASSRTFTNIDYGNNSWNGGAATSMDYATNYTYDAMGNILTLERNAGGATPQAMDNMSYNYHTNANGLVSNRLYSVNDAVSSGNYGDDIDDQGVFNNAHLTIETANNYGYDELGNLVRDDAEEIANIEWTVYGKIKSVTRTGPSTKPDLEFGYDASGNRLWKKVIPKTSGAVVKTFYYLRDAQGNTMSRYVEYTETSTSTQYYVAQEHVIYGSSRLGVDNRLDTLYENGNYSPAWFTDNISHRDLGLKSYEMSNHLGNVLVTVSDKKMYIGTPGSSTLNNIYHNDFNSNTGGWVGLGGSTTSASFGNLEINGTSNCEAEVFIAGGIVGPMDLQLNISGTTNISNIIVSVTGSGDGLTYTTVLSPGLGIKNVPISRAVVQNYTISIMGTTSFPPPSTFIIMVDEASLSYTSYIPGLVEYFEPEIRSISDYYPFGSAIKTRAYSSGAYLYGFGGHKKDNEFTGIGTSIDMGARFYDTRLGKTLSIDPAYDEYPSLSSYSGFANNPLIFADPDGKRIYFVPGLGYNEKKPPPSKYVTGVATSLAPYLKEHGTYSKTIQASNGGTFSDMLYVVFRGQKPRQEVANDKRAMMMINSIVQDLNQNPLKDGEQMNIVATSQGAVSAAQATIAMLEDPIKYGLDEGFFIDNLVLAGSPISPDSELFKKLESLKEQGKIGNIEYEDYQAEGDVVTGLSGKHSFGAMMRGFGYIGKIIQAIGQTVVGKELTDPHIRASENMSVTKDSDTSFSDGIKDLLKEDEVH